MREMRKVLSEQAK